MHIRIGLLLLATWLLGPSLPGAHGEEEYEHGAAIFARYANGDGPRVGDGVVHLLDTAGTKGQSNAAAWPLSHEGAHDNVHASVRMQVGEGGDGGAFVFLNTEEYGREGPAPFVRDWTAPNLRGTFAVGIDVHNPKNEEPFGPWGNYLGNPEREVSLHWDGREIVKRVSPTEFRGMETLIDIDAQFVSGGAEVTVEIGGVVIYDHYFIAHMLPYESRLAIGAGTRADAATVFDVKQIFFIARSPAAPRRPPLHVEVFNHVLTNNKKTAYEAELELPPANWSFGRVILTLDIHDAGKDWDEWDRNGEISIQDDEGTWRGIVPFITSYRTECHWKVDVTHFRPYLTGTRKIRIAAGTTFYKNRGYMMSVSLDFHHGTPRHVPYAVIPVWHGTAKYRSAENHFQDFFEPQSAAIGEEATTARIFTTTTGHSQVGEFTPSRRTITVANAPAEGEPTAQAFDNTLWKADCYLNPNRPQFGTWKFARAGWAPGDVVWPWWIELTPEMWEGGKLELRYQPKPYQFPEGKAPGEKQINQASHVVRSYLILYRKPEALVPAPILRVTNVAKNSNAANAGMLRGDYFASYDGARVDSIDDLRAALEAAAEARKEKVTVVVYRGTRRIELELDAGRMGINLGG